MSTSSKIKTEKKNDSVGYDDNNVAKVNTTGYTPIKEFLNSPVAGSRQRSKEIAAKNKAEILRKEAAGEYKDVELSKKPVGVAFREIFNMEPKQNRNKK